MSLNFLSIQSLNFAFAVGVLFPSTINGGGNATILQELSNYDKDFVSVCHEVNILVDFVKFLVTDCI